MGNIRVSKVVGTGKKPRVWSLKQKTFPVHHNKSTDLRLQTEIYGALPAMKVRKSIPIDFSRKAIEKDTLIYKLKL